MKKKLPPTDSSLKRTAKPTNKKGAPQGASGKENENLDLKQPPTLGVSIPSKKFRDAIISGNLDLFQGVAELYKDIDPEAFKREILLAKNEYEFNIEDLIYIYFSDHSKALTHQLNILFNDDRWHECQTIKELDSITHHFPNRLSLYFHTHKHFFDVVLHFKAPIPPEYKTVYEKFNYMCCTISQSPKDFPQFKIMIDPDSKTIKSVFYNDGQ